MSSGSDNSGRVRVTQGVLQGEACVTKNGKQYWRYLGVPYAHPPLGELRFRKPTPPQKWAGVRMATKEGNDAPQIDEHSKEYVGDEDCLYLNVAVPSFPEDALDSLPVFVYIHGGGFINGTSSFQCCGPEHIIEKDCIFVSMNYRLNVLGFLCLETDDCPGNMGLQDQHLALKWIHENISVFGGNPGNVTLIGISAGAASVESHILSPKTPKNLFHKAIMQSGTIANMWAIERDYLDIAYRLADKLGNHTKDKKEMLELFKNASVKDLISAASRLLTLDDFKKYCSFGCFKPVVWSGNEFLNKLPVDLLAQGEFLKIPTIYGFCSSEYLFLKELYDNTDEYKERSYEDLLPLQLDVERNQYAQDFKNIYGLLDKDSRNGKKSGDFITDLVMLNGIFSTVDMKLTCNLPLYFYCFSYDGKLNYSKRRQGIVGEGAAHADDQTYIGTNSVVTEEEVDPADIAVRKTVIHMWTDFAKFGDPTPRLNQEVTTKWCPLSKEEFVYMDINEDLVLNRGLDEYMRKRRDIWIELYKHYSSSLN